MNIYDRKLVKPKKFPWFYFICHLKHVIYINVITFIALDVVSMTKRVKNNNFWIKYIKISRDWFDFMTCPVILINQAFLYDKNI